MYVEEHHHCFTHCLGVKALSGTLLGPAFGHFWLKKGYRVIFKKGYGVTGLGAEALRPRGAAARGGRRGLRGHRAGSVRAARKRAWECWVGQRALDGVQDACLCFGGPS